MTQDAKSWPDKPGFPINPKKPGIHWLFTPDNDAVVKFWAGDAWELVEGATTARKAAQDGWRYLGPCLPPDTANALIKALKDLIPEAINDRYMTQSYAVEQARAAIAKATGGQP